MNLKENYIREGLLSLKSVGRLRTLNHSLRALLSTLILISLSISMSIPDLIPLVCGGNAPAQGGPAPQPMEPHKMARLSITFDDAWNDTYYYALPILAERGIRASLMVPTGFIGEPGRMTWPQIQELARDHKWEIGSHSVTHRDLTLLNADELRNEIVGSKRELEEHGISVKSFALPVGAYNDVVIRNIALHYEFNRVAWRGYNTLPYNDYEIKAITVMATDSVSTVKGWIDHAIANGLWLVLVFHQLVKGEASQYAYNVKDFEEIIDYASKRIITLPICEVPDSVMKENELPNPSFSATLGDWVVNWTRSDPDRIVIDSNYHGAQPEPLKSIKVIGSAEGSNSVASSLVPVAPSKLYCIRAYWNIPSFSSGGANLWIDEFDASRRWIGGKWMGGQWTTCATMKGWTYAPSPNASFVRLSFFSDPGSDLTWYIDRAELREISFVNVANLEVKSYPSSYHWPDRLPGPDLGARIRVRYWSAEGVHKEEILTTPFALNVALGSTAILAVEEPQPEGHSWGSWDVYGLGQRDEPVRSVIMDGDHIAIAYFALGQSLAVRAYPLGFHWPDAAPSEDLRASILVEYMDPIGNKVRGVLRTPFIIRCMRGSVANLTVVHPMPKGYCWNPESVWDDYLESYGKLGERSLRLHMTRNRDAIAYFAPIRFELNVLPITIYDAGMWGFQVTAPIRLKANCEITNAAIEVSVSPRGAAHISKPNEVSLKPYEERVERVIIRLNWLARRGIYEVTIKIIHAQIVSEAKFSFIKP